MTSDVDTLRGRGEVAGQQTARAAATRSPAASGLAADPARVL
ncbi:MAG: hypothetical protein RML45_09625 [Acetobacteraceae bacterium]|nr:hypothetical protein [Acetobacteraceae bacterium]